jgi:hypothetical protein
VAASCEKLPSASDRFAPIVLISRWLIGPCGRDSVLRIAEGDAAMMGMQVEPAQLFYEFRLDDHVPADHLLRRIDRFLYLESVPGSDQ